MRSHEEEEGLCGLPPAHVKAAAVGLACGLEEKVAAVAVARGLGLVFGFFGLGLGEWAFSTPAVCAGGMSPGMEMRTVSGVLGVWTEVGEVEAAAGDGDGAWEVNVGAPSATVCAFHRSSIR